ncbi:hypothetical protein DMA12_37940 [Amycolatopsis balhimycina DSM 5908]|uniref:Uncharacterized protein n=1 Tax=Amycolatopsis balhimycina DSM 5908 TaxID=1081091 RepID=A0A428W213_AMYBA|nr:hypothetical protein [Amycolatopsis balhimycina]RSM37104.1 hypothetical protein DMA12_37940 [Amycolatopsis balhimycina DSM 5908]
MGAQLRISREEGALPCEVCGFPTMHVAQVVADDGTVLGRTLVCTTCQLAKQHPEPAATEAEAPPDEVQTA